MADGSYTHLSEGHVLPDPALLVRLTSLCGAHGALALAEKLASLAAFVGPVLSRFESVWRTLPSERDRVTRSANTLLLLKGKRLRPICVALAAHLGSAGFSERALQLAVAVELVHAATLLHDDVIDVAELRRGRPTARTLYGNAASIFAGDWLLIEALRRVRCSGFLPLLDGLLETIDEMIEAEALQLENRGRLNASLSDYFKVIEGKTAALFRWAMRAGAVAGGLPEEQETLLMRFGTHLGTAFQLQDDILDITGEPEVTGKPRFADLREGKLTYPLLMALEYAPELLTHLQVMLDVEQRRAQAGEGGDVGSSADSGDAEAQALAAVTRALRESGAEALTRARAAEEGARALACLEAFPASAARQCLETVVAATLSRDR